MGIVAVKGLIIFLLSYLMYLLLTPAYDELLVRKKNAGKFSNKNESFQKNFFLSSPEENLSDFFLLFSLKILIMMTRKTQQQKKNMFEVVRNKIFSCHKTLKSIIIRITA